MYAESWHGSTNLLPRCQQNIPTGTEGVMSMSNIALLVEAELSRPGCVVLAHFVDKTILQGACDMGALPEFPRMQVSNPEVLAKFEKAWGTKLNPNQELMQ